MNNARFILSRSRVLDRYNFLRKICPNVSYSLKTNPEVGRVLEDETDCPFGVHAIESLSDVRTPGRVHFMIQANSKSDLKKLLGMGIRTFIVDNECDLKNFIDVLNKEKISVNLFLRIRFQETTVYKGRFFLFGMTADEINNLIPRVRKNPNIDKLGIHFHRKTQNTGNWNLKYMLEEMLSEENLNLIDSVNIGGGIPVDYKNTKASNLEYILDAIKELSEWLMSKNIEMVMEPGRFISAPAVKLEAYIISVQGKHITINCSVYNTFTDIITFPIKPLVEGEGKGDSYIIKGCTPDSLDIFRYDVKLREPKIGDRIVFMNIGAYNFTTSFFNLKRPETVIVE